jgi:hypothetical protein
LAPVPKVGTDMIFKAYNKLFISWHCPFKKDQNFNCHV